MREEKEGGETGFPCSPERVQDSSHHSWLGWYLIRRATRTAPPFPSLDRRKKVAVRKFPSSSVVVAYCRPMSLRFGAEKGGRRAKAAPFFSRNCEKIKAWDTRMHGRSEGRKSEKKARNFADRVKFYGKSRFLFIFLLTNCRTKFRSRSPFISLTLSSRISPRT